MSGRGTNAARRSLALFLAASLVLGPQAATRAADAADAGSRSHRAQAHAERWTPPPEGPRERTEPDSAGEDPTRGAASSGSVATKNPYRFQGRWRDSAEGSPLYYFRFRMYEPGSGRFTTRDPVYDPANVGNGYAFVAGNPVSRIDPAGLQGLSVELRFKRDPSIDDAALWTLGGERATQSFIQAWFDIALANLQAFAKAPVGTPATLAVGGLTAAQVGVAANAVIAALTKEPTQAIVLTTNVKTDKASSSTEGTGSGAIVRINPKQSESNFFIAQSIMHELFHKYGGLLEQPYPQVNKGGKCEEADRDIAQFVTELFFLKPGAAAVGAVPAIPTAPPGATAPRMWTPPPVTVPPGKTAPPGVPVAPVGSPTAPGPPAPSPGGGR